MTKTNIVLAVVCGIMAVGLMTAAIVLKTRTQPLQTQPPALHQQVQVVRPPLSPADKTRAEQIWAEIDYRFNMFEQRIDTDRAGAIVAFDSPEGRFTTTIPDLNKYGAVGLLLELYRLHGVTLDVPKDWPPSFNEPHDQIRAKVGAFKAEADLLRTKPNGANNQR